MSPLLKLCIMRVIQKKGLQAVQIVPLIRDAEKYLQTMGLTPATIKSIVSTWKAVIPFMESHGILLYSAKDKENNNAAVLRQWLKENIC